MILDVKYEIKKDIFHSNQLECFWIIKKLFVFNKLIFSFRIYNFFDKKDGAVPYFIEDVAKNVIRILNMKKDEQTFLFINSNYFITEDRGIYSIIKETFFFCFSFSYNEITASRDYLLIVDKFNEILDKEYK